MFQGWRWVAVDPRGVIGLLPVQVPAPMRPKIEMHSLWLGPEISEMRHRSCLRGGGKYRPTLQDMCLLHLFGLYVFMFLNMLIYLWCPCKIKAPQNISRITSITRISLLPRHFIICLVIDSALFTSPCYHGFFSFFFTNCKSLHYLQLFVLRWGRRLGPRVLWGDHSDEKRTQKSQIKENWEESNTTGECDFHVQCD